MGDGNYHERKRKNREAAKLVTFVCYLGLLVFTIIALFMGWSSQ